MLPEQPALAEARQGMLNALRLLDTIQGGSIAAARLQHAIDSLPRQQADTWAVTSEAPFRTV